MPDPPADIFTSDGISRAIGTSGQTADPGPVGLIGLGLLGTALSERLLLAGFHVWGYDLAEPRCRILAQAGGTAAVCATDVVRRCQTVVLSLPDSTTVARLLDSVADSLQSQQLIIDTTTGDPAVSATLGHTLASRQVDFVDATVVGSSEQARQGDVVCLVGGTAAAFRRASPILRAFSSRLFHTGTHGTGATAKLVVNLVLGLNRAVLAEGLALAQFSGIELPMALDILRNSAAWSRVMDVKGEKMITGDFTPQARLNQHWKDVQLILELGRRTGASLPLSLAHHQLLQRASELGFGELDNSAVIQALLTPPQMPPTVRGTASEPPGAPEVQSTPPCQP